MYRRSAANTRGAATSVQVLLVHPGGPFWQNKDLGAWSIPKGEIEDGEDPLAAAQREFFEELGTRAAGPFVGLTPVKQKGGKIVHAWAFEGDLDPATIRCNTFRMEWPPRSGTWVEFAEVDRAEWFDLAQAREKINSAQAAFLLELSVLLSNVSG